MTQKRANEEDTQADEDLEPRSANGICPKCGCFMEEYLDDWERDADGNPQIVSITLSCPCCEYEQTSYDG